MTDQSTALTTTTQQQTAGALSFLHDGAAFDQLWRVAQAFAGSRMVPAHFQGKPHDCMVALMYAEQLSEHPMVIFQETQIINGKPGTSARFAIARAKRSGVFSGPITWTSKGKGESLEVTATATLRETGEKVSVSLSMATAIAEGWTRNAKYKSIPEQMLRWRSASWLINLYAPECLFGLSVADELQPVVVRDASAPVGGGDVVADLNRQIAAAEVVEVAEVQPEPEPAPSAAPAAVETVEDPF